MKKSGSKCEFNAERDAALYSAYREVLRRRETLSATEMSREISRMPCRRFWVSEERATIVVSALLRDSGATGRMHRSKQRMYGEIWRRAARLLAERPGASLYNIVSEVVNSPAPEFYLSPRYITDRLPQIRRQQTVRARQIWRPVE